MTSRTARLSSAGCALFLSGEELEELGVDPDTSENVEYRLENGEIRLIASDK